MKFDEIVARLEKAGIESAKEEATAIMKEIGVSYGELVFFRGKDYDSKELCDLVAKREKRIPLQYATQKAYFMDSEFYVTPDCLIPRADTEILVYEALKYLEKGNVVADLCTGSGCIGLSILKSKCTLEKMYLVDISASALEVAKENTKRLRFVDKCELVKKDATKFKPKERLDMIVANPPYILSEDIDDLSEEVKKEPRLALDGGRDGLDIIRPLIENAPKQLKENGYILIEFGFDQGHKIKEIMEEKVASGAYKAYKILKDYGGNDRVLVAQV